MQFSTCKVLDLTKAAGARLQHVMEAVMSLALIFTHDSGI